MSISDSDHIAIQRLMYRYARCADHKDYEGFAAVFCEVPSNPLLRRAGYAMHSDTGDDAHLRKVHEHYASGP